MSDWSTLVEHYLIYERQRYELYRIEANYAKSSDAIEMVKRELNQPLNTHKALALEVLYFMGEVDRKSVFSEVFSLALNAKEGLVVDSALNIIKSLPREWVMQHLENEIEKQIVLSAESIDYNMLLNFTEWYAPEVARTIVKRALDHPDEYIQAVGESYSHRLDRP